jgi:hypothetical protein
MKEEKIPKVSNVEIKGECLRGRREIKMETMSCERCNTWKEGHGKKFRWMRSCGKTETGRWGGLVVRRFI